MNAPILNAAVVRLHAENAAFLARHVELARDGPNERLVDIYDFEARLGGHLRALALAGAPALSLAEELLAADRGFGTLFLAFFLSLRSRPGHALADHFAAAGEPPSLADAPALAAAVAALPPEVTRERVGRWLAGADPVAACVALGALGRLRADPRAHLAPLLRHREPPVAAMAARVAGELGRADLAPAVLAALRGAEAAGLRFEAARAAALLGERTEAPRVLAALSPAAPPSAWREAAELLPVVLPPTQARKVIGGMFAEPLTRRWAVVAAGALGAADTFDWLVARMEDPLLARAAGTAFTTIAGLRLGPHNLEMTEFPDDPDDAVVSACPVETFIESHAYWPDPARIADWFRAARGRFAAIERHLLGTAAWAQGLPPDNAELPQLSLRALAVEIACRSPAAPLPNWRAPVSATSTGFARKW